VFTAREMRVVPGRALSRGFAQKRGIETVLRDALSSDSLDPRGIYFGTGAESSTDREMKERAGRKLWKDYRRSVREGAVVHMDGAPTTKPNLKSRRRKRRNLHVRKCHAQEITLMQVMFTIPGPHCVSSSESERRAREVEAGANLLQFCKRYSLYTRDCVTEF